MNVFHHMNECIMNSILKWFWLQFLINSVHDKPTYVICVGKMGHNEQIFKNELFLFSHSPLKDLQND